MSIAGVAITAGASSEETAFATARSLFSAMHIRPSQLILGTEELEDLNNVCRLRELGLVATVANIWLESFSRKCFETVIHADCMVNRVQKHAYLYSRALFRCAVRVRNSSVLVSVHETGIHNSLSGSLAESSTVTHEGAEIQQKCVHTRTVTRHIHAMAPCDCGRSRAHSKLRDNVYVGHIEVTTPHHE